MRNQLLMHCLELWGQQAALRKAVPGSHEGGVTRSGISCTTAHVSPPAFSAVRLFPGRQAGVELLSAAIKP